MQADITVLSLGHFGDGVVEDPLRTLVLNGTARQVTDTFVAGQPVVVVGGTLPGIDLQALRAEGQRLFDQMRAAYSVRDAQRGTPDELFPPAYPRAEVSTPVTVREDRTLKLSVRPLLVWYTKRAMVEQRGLPACREAHALRKSRLLTC